MKKRIRRHGPERYDPERTLTGTIRTYRDFCRQDGVKPVGIYLIILNKILAVGLYVILTFMDIQLFQ
jgi:hypothetical protein